MKTERFYRWIGWLGASAIVAGALGLSLPSPNADPRWRPRIAQRTWTQKRPRVAIDEAHWNTHTASGRLSPFATLLRDDGYSLSRYMEPVHPETLRLFNVLVIANPLGLSGTLGLTTTGSFERPEIEAIHAYVNKGGSLLLVASGGAAGAASQPLARSFGIDLTDWQVGNHRVRKGPECVAGRRPQALTLTYGKGKVAVIDDVAVVSLSIALCENVRFLRDLMEWLSDGAQ